jgi:hypothetical protein
MAEEIQNIFAFKIFKNYNENVISARVVNSTPPSMVNNELYYIAIRVEVNMTNPYTKIYE